MTEKHRLFFPTTQKNKDPLIKIIKNFLPKNGIILEIGSGSGEHGVLFQKLFPKLIWQTSDPNELHRKSINS